jgi:hypothetical protein
LYFPYGCFEGPWDLQDAFFPPTRRAPRFSGIRRGLDKGTRIHGRIATNDHANECRGILHYQPQHMVSSLFTLLVGGNLRFFPILRMSTSPRLPQNVLKPIFPEVSLLLLPLSPPLFWGAVSVLR